MFRLRTIAAAVVAALAVSAAPASAQARCTWTTLHGSSCGELLVVNHTEGVVVAEELTPAPVTLAVWVPVRALRTELTPRSAPVGRGSTG